MSEDTAQWIQVAALSDVPAGEAKAPGRFIKVMVAVALADLDGVRVPCCRPFLVARQAGAIMDAELASNMGDNAGGYLGGIGEKSSEKTGGDEL